ncbi:MAG: metal ABC transporter substrate-binding protein [Campylobacterota bacterium]|nr:metal ABC transporter substrate-binding protein [Campylobacterota bacterium]
MKNFRNIIFVLVVIVFVLQMIVMKEDSKLEAKPLNAPIGLSTFALYDIAKNVGGDTQEFFMLMPFGADAHSFEPTPKLIAKIQRSSLVIYSGAGLQPWIEDFDFENRAVDMSHHIKLKIVDNDNSCSHEHHDENEHQHHHKESSSGAVDHHYWLDMDNMVKMTEMVTRELIIISPKNKDLYNKNKDTYITMLKKLDADYKKILSSCKKETIVVNHNAFSYLSDKYGFHTQALSGLSPDAQPDAKTMIKLIEVVKEHNLSTVFFESFASDKAMKSIAKEAGVGVDVLQPLGNITADEAKNNMSYEDIMRQNLEKISKALECK